MDEYRDSTDLLGDGVGLRGRLADEGYLFFRGLLDAERVDALRRQVLERIAALGWLRDGTDPAEQRPGPTARPEMADDYWDGYRAIQGLHAFHALAHEAALVAMTETLVGEEVLVHPRKIARVSYPFGMTPTPPHQDYRYIQGTVDAFTVWAPLGDCPGDLGGLEVLRGSQDRGLLPTITSEGAGGLGVVTDPDDPDWASTEYESGDVILFHSLTVHGARPNHRDKVRLSVDYRYQSAREPVVRASLHPHFHPDVPDWDDLAADWPDRDVIAGAAEGLSEMRPPSSTDFVLSPSRFVEVPA